jgi:hypothetical protein
VAPNEEVTHAVVEMNFDQPVGFPASGFPTGFMAGPSRPDPLLLCYGLAPHFVLSFGIPRCVLRFATVSPSGSGKRRAGRRMAVCRQHRSANASPYLSAGRCLPQSVVASIRLRRQRRGRVSWREAETAPGIRITVIGNPLVNLRRIGGGSISDDRYNYSGARLTIIPGRPRLRGNAACGPTYHNADCTKPLRGNSVI